MACSVKYSRCNNKIGSNKKIFFFELCIIIFFVKNIFFSNIIMAIINRNKLAKARIRKRRYNRRPRASKGVSSVVKKYVSRAIARKAETKTSYVANQVTFGNYN